jgi:hypothetical protein
MEISPEFKKMIEQGKKKERALVISGDTPLGRALRVKAGDRVTLVPAPIEVPPDAPTVITNGKKVRHVFIEATFPELKGGQMYQHAHGEASGTKPAIARAFKNLLKTIPKKRISVISAKISITTKIVEG